MECVILVDYRNILIEGRKCSARGKGICAASAQDKPPIDMSWSIDFAGLLTELADGRRVRKAIVVGAWPPADDSLWEPARQSGIEVIVNERLANWREKAIDTELVAQGTLIVATTPAPAILVMASGDRDFVPLFRVARQTGWITEAAAFSTAFPPGGAMEAVVDRVRSLDSAIAHIGRCEFSWP